MQSIDSRKVGTTDVTITFITPNPANFISSQGEIRLSTYTTQKTSTDFYCNADFTQVTIKYAVPNP